MIMSRYRTKITVAAVLILAGSTTWTQAAEPPPLDRRQPTSQPQTAPATQPPAYTAKMLPLDSKVQDILDKARQAYAGLRTYQDLGSVTMTMTVQGRTQEATSPAATTFEKPSKFVASHEAMNLYSDGKTLWFYMPGRGRYFQSPLSEATGPSGPGGLQIVLRNLPALSLLVMPETSVLSTKEAYQSKYQGQEKVADHQTHHITLSVPATTWFGPAASQPASNPSKVLMDAYFDTKDSMLVRLNLNMTEAMKDYYSSIQQGSEHTPELQQVSWQFNAGHVRLNAPISDETFVFKVPAEAVQVDSFAALISTPPSQPPVNDEEEAERSEAEQANLPFPAPDFTLPDLSDQKVKLSSFLGKVVLVDFWATWCPPCRAALPGIQKLHDEFAKEGLQVLAVDLGEDAQTVLNFAEKNKMTFKVLLNEKSSVSQSM